MHGTQSITLTNMLNKLMQYLKVMRLRLTEANLLVLSIMDGITNIPTFSRGMSQERGTKAWIKESTPAYLAAKSKLAHVRKAKIGFRNELQGRLSEFGRFAKITSWIIGNKALYKHFHKFLLRVEQMLIRNGSNYTFKYMKECLRLAVRALAGVPETSTNYSPGQIRVRRDSYGIPTLLPLTLRLVLHAYIINYDRAPSHIGDGGSEEEGWDRVSYDIAYPRSHHFNQRNIVGVLTLLSVFRVFATKVEPTLSTIISPFMGEVKTFNSELIHKALAVSVSHVEKASKFDFATGGTITIKKYIAGETPTLNIGKFTPHLSVKSGPNGNFSTWGAGLDALAFMHEPSKFVALVRWMYAQRSYRWIVIFLVINLTFGRIYLLFFSLGELSTYLLGLVSRLGGSRLYYFLKPILAMPRWARVIIGPGLQERSKLYLGKLGVVYDQAGKARVVASTNWWIQSALKGLHTSIFSVLKSMPKDGTMDQEAAFNRFITNHDKLSKMSGFDLSAATDRLPIEIQQTVLNCCGVNGSLWAELMQVTYSAPFENKENLQEVEYAVGQPMGAYSSWAMLALTHHVIVNLAAIYVGQDKEDVNYAVLGDDVVINNDLVAEKYVELMTDLGLEISMGKSVISNRFTEFAKKLKGPGIDFSPIGAGAILAASRSGLMLPQVFLSAIGNVITSPEEILDRLRDFPSGLISKHQAAGYLSIVLWQLFGPNSPLAKGSPVNFGRLIGDMLEFVPGIPKGGHAFAHLKDSMGNLFTRQMRTNIALSYMPLKLFIMNSLIMVVSGSPLMRVLETLMKPFNPGFWIYLDMAITAPFKLNDHWDNVYASYPPFGGPGSSYFRSMAIIRILSENTPELQVLKLDLSKKELQTRARYLIDLRKDMNARYELSQQFAWPKGLHTRWYELEGNVPR